MEEGLSSKRGSEKPQVVVKSKRQRERETERATKIEVANEMAKRTHTERDKPAVPHSLAVRRERSRELAQKRRTTYKSIMSDLAQELPFSRDVISQVDYNSRLRLALCYFRMKSLSGETGAVKKEVMEYKKKPAFPQPGMLQDFMTEVLCVCVCVCVCVCMCAYA